MLLLPLFQSTPPSLAETYTAPETPEGPGISIHSAIASGDADMATYGALMVTFQSTPPSLAETEFLIKGLAITEFQSTPPSLAETLKRVRVLTKSTYFNPLRHR